MFDILASTSNRIMIDCSYKNELPVYYDPPKPQKIIFTENDLFKADCFSFGSIIGQITNKSSNAYALLPNLVKKYGSNSDEVKLTESRLQQCCKAQSMQIDKAKIGREVKGIPKVWTEKQTIADDDNDETIQKKELLNRCLLNKHPYFFIYRYRETKLKYKNYIKNSDTTCRIKFGASIDELCHKDNLSEDERVFIENYREHMPVIISDSAMNKLCGYIENQNLEILKKVKEESDPKIIEYYKNKKAPYCPNTKKRIIRQLKLFLNSIEGMCKSGIIIQEDKLNMESLHKYENYLDEVKNELLTITNNIYEITNYLIDYYYIDYPKSNKTFLWDLVGKYIYKNIIINLNCTGFYVPVENTEGDVLYLGKHYSLEKVDLKENANDY